MASGQQIRILEIHPNAEVFLEKLELRDGYSTTIGGAIHNDQARLTMVSCVVRGNRAVGTRTNDGGGGLYNDRGTLNMTSCLVSLGLIVVVGPIDLEKRRERERESVCVCESERDERIRNE